MGSMKYNVFSLCHIKRKLTLASLTTTSLTQLCTSVSANSLNSAPINES